MQRKSEDFAIKIKRCIEEYYVTYGESPMVQYMSNLWVEEIILKFLPSIKRTMVKDCWFYSW